MIMNVRTMKPEKIRLRTAWLLTTFLSIAVAFGFYLSGKYGDCGPTEIDGQCGMSSFVELWFGIVAGATIFVTMTVYFLIVARRR